MSNRTSQEWIILHHIMSYTSTWSRFELTTSVVIGTNCIGSCKSNYHTIMPTTAPSLKFTILPINWIIIVVVICKNFERKQMWILFKCRSPSTLLSVRENRRTFITMFKSCRVNHPCCHTTLLWIIFKTGLSNDIATQLVISYFIWHA